MPIYMGVFDAPNVLSKDFRGSVTAKGYEGWIELKSANVRAQRSIAAAGNGGGTGKSTASEIVIYKLMDSTSGALFRESSWGKGKLVVIAFVRRGQPTMTMILRDTLVSDRGMAGHDGIARSEPTESLTLNFTQITYNAQDKSPDVTRQSLHQLSDPAAGSWDL